MGRRLGPRPPSALVRAALSLVLLAGFYALILGVALALFAAPIWPVYMMLHEGRLSLQIGFLVAICWIAAWLLAGSVFGVRRPPFVPPRRRLRRVEAPALFEAIDDLASRAGTPPPTEVYLDPLPNLAVTEVGGLLRTRRVLIVGAPLLHFLTVDELRVGIAHELGHFLGGDTRLTTFTAHTHALFASVVNAVKRDPFRTERGAIGAGFAFAEAIGKALVRGYGRLFLRLTRPINQRQELAADALSATLVGGRAARQALEKISLGAPLYSRYLAGDVGFAVARGAMPTDLVAGFERMRERHATTGEGRAFIEAVRREVTDPYDTHPALGDRLAALAEHPDVEGPSDERPAASLLADVSAFEAWLVEETREHLTASAVASGMSLPATRALSWAAIPAEVYAPATREAARRTAQRLHPMFPGAATLGDMLGAVWRALEAGKMVEVALRVEPGVGRLPRPQGMRAAVQVCGQLLAMLLQGALLERGAELEDSLGEPALVFRFAGERVVPAEVMRRLATDVHAGRAEVDAWARRLGSDGAPSGP